MIRRLIITIGRLIFALMYWVAICGCLAVAARFNS